VADIAATSNGDPAVVFMVSAGLVYEIVAAACSSPQTTELNAGSRSDTLMKWVSIGLVQSAFFVIIAIFLAHGGPRKMAAGMGGGLAGVVMAICYYHAKESGLRSSKPGTETYT
jgi:hypothetical protein